MEEQTSKRVSPSVFESARSKSECIRVKLPRIDIDPSILLCAATVKAPGFEMIEGSGQLVRSQVHLVKVP